MTLTHFRHLDYHQWAPEQDVISTDHYVVAASSTARGRAVLQRRPHPRPRRRPAVDADGALDERRQLAAGQPGEGPRPDAPQQPRARRPRRGHHRLLPVAPVARGLREVPLRPGPARRPRQRALARGRASSAPSRSASARCVGVDGRGRGRDPVGLPGRLGGLRPGHALLGPGLRPGGAHDGPPRCCATGITADVVHPGADLTATGSSSCPPSTSCATSTPPPSRRLPRPARRCWSPSSPGSATSRDHVRLGGYPGAFRDLLGVRVEEFFPARSTGEAVALSEGSGRLWTEDVTATSAPGPEHRTRTGRCRASRRHPQRRSAAGPRGTSAPCPTTTPSPRCSTGSPRRGVGPGRRRAPRRRGGPPSRHRRPLAVRSSTTPASSSAST